jgi:hypothetical protein
VLRKIQRKLSKIFTLMAMIVLITMGVPMVADTNQFFDSRVSVFKMNDGSDLRDMSSHIKRMRGLPGQIKMNDVTAFGSVGERPGPSIYIAHFTVLFMFNMVATTGVWTVLAGMYSSKALRAFEYYPAGTTTGNPKFSGNCYMANAPIEGQAGEYVTLECEFWVDNGVTVGTA